MNPRRVLPLTALALLALAGCGIRPTAVPVDAGAPASRTACPNPVQVPSAAGPTPVPSGENGFAPATPATTAPATPGKTPGPAKTPPLVTATPTAPVFSASASPSASRCP